jgi:hypothetical protein
MQEVKPVGSHLTPMLPSQFPNEAVSTLFNFANTGKLDHADAVVSAWLVVGYGLKIGVDQGVFGADQPAVAPPPQPSGSKLPPWVWELAVKALMEFLQHLGH